MPFTIDNIPSDRLLHFIAKDDLITILGDKFQPIQAEANATKSKLTAAFIKERVANDNEFIERFRRSAEGARAFQKYLESYARLTNPETKAKRAQVRKLMAEPRRGFIGCVATKLEPTDFKDCVDNYDRDEYQAISLVPSAALKDSAYHKTGESLLAPRPNQRQHISYLPTGLRAYMLSHPDQYESYITERKAELKLLKAVRRNARYEQEGRGAPASSLPVLPASSVEEIEPIERGKRRRELPQV